MRSAFLRSWVVVGALGCSSTPEVIDLFDTDASAVPDRVIPPLDVRPPPGPDADTTGPDAVVPPPPDASEDLPKVIIVDDVETCAAPQRICDGRCVDPRSDLANCGACGRRCPDGSVCSASACMLPAPGCDPPRVQCGAVCADIGADAMNCGRCGNACLAGETCAAGTCATMGTTGMRVPGAPCMNSGGCPGGACQPAAFGWFGGYCIFPCSTSADCGANGVCVRSSTGQTFCLRSCAARSDCREGYACATLNSGTVRACVPSCLADPGLVCGAYACNTATEGCRSPCASAADCSAGSTCSSGRCVCGPTTRCGAGRGCVGGNCGCTSDAGCGPDLRCNPATGQCAPR